MENVSGRMNLDIFRHVLTACNLASFSLINLSNLKRCCRRRSGWRLWRGGRLWTFSGMCSQPATWLRSAWWTKYLRFMLQETFRVENVEGRVILDILRHVLTACNLASFSLVDCAQSLLGRRLEVLPPSAVTSLSSLPKGCSASK